jgi:hypothetical protein
VEEKLIDARDLGEKGGGRKRGGSRKNENTGKN